MTYANGIPVLVLGQAQKCGRIKPVNGIPNRNVTGIKKKCTLECREFTTSIFLL
jgi:hypothetical protein